MCYYHKQAENLSFGVEWETNFRVRESTATFGYQIDMPDEGVKLNGQWGIHYSQLGHSLGTEIC